MLQFAEVCRRSKRSVPGDSLIALDERFHPRGHRGYGRPPPAAHACVEQIRGMQGKSVVRGSKSRFVGLYAGTIRFLRFDDRQTVRTSPLSDTRAGGGDLQIRLFGKAL